MPGEKKSGTKISGFAETMYICAIIIFFHANKDMDNLIRALKTRCAAAGTNLTEVCREAGVNRSTIERWKGHTPKSLQLLDSIEKALAEREKQQSNGNA
ncbi:MAG: helix-turn-helix domain-containing protein [Saprospiraceae bacterium]